MEIFALFFSGMFVSVWNVFAVIGVVATFKWIITRSQVKQERVNTQAVAQSTPTLPATREIDMSPPTQAITKVVEERKEKSQPNFTEKVIRQEWDKSSVLLYSGAFLVGFAIFLFVAFNWESYTDLVRSFLSVTIMALLYALAFVFSSDSKFKKVSDTFLLLASVAFVLAGIGLWNFHFRLDGVLPFNDYWSLFSLLMIAVFALTHATTKRKIYLWAVAFSSFSFLISGSDLFLNDLLQRMSFIIFLTPLVWLMVRFLTRTDQERLHTFNLFRLFYILVDLINVLLLFGGLYNVSDGGNALIFTISLFYPNLFTVGGIYLEKRSFGLLYDGFLIPFKLLVGLRLLFPMADFYYYLGVSLTGLTTAWFISMLKSFSGADRLRRLIIPMIFASGILSFMLPFDKPLDSPSWDVMPAIISFATISLLIAVRASKYGRSWPRVFNIPLDLAVTIMAVLKVGEYLGVSFEPYVYSVILFIPTAIYVAQWIIRRNSNKGGSMLYLGSAIFLGLSLLLSTGNTLFLIVGALVLVGFLKISLLITRKSLFAYPLFASTIYLGWSVIFWLQGEYVYIGWSRYRYYNDLYIKGLILMAVLTLSMGNLWRGGIAMKYKGLKQEIFKKFQYSAVGSSLIILFLLYGSVIMTDWSVMWLFGILLLIFITVQPSLRWFRYLSGIPLVFAFWNLLGHSDTPAYANSHLFALPIVLYLGSLSYLTQDRKAMSRAFFMLANIIPLIICLMQSITDPEGFRVYHGILLILLGSLQLIYGSYKKDKLLIVIASVFILIELLIRLWDVIVQIPSWMYIGLIGLSLIGLSIWIIYRLAGTGGINSNNVDTLSKEPNKK